MMPAFDVALAVRRIVAGFWHDFAPIIVLGIGLVMLPQVALAVAGNRGGSTILATFGGMLRVLYVVIVSYGALARLQDKPLSARDYVTSGLAASPRAIGVALLLGAGVVLVLVGLLLASLAADATLIRTGLVAAAFAAAVIVAPAIPLALVTPLVPFRAVGAAVVLTRGARGGIAAVLGIVALAIVPARFVLAATVYGLGASVAQSTAVDRAMTLASPGLWLLALFDLLAWGIAAIVPAVVFAGLMERRGL